MTGYHFVNTLTENDLQGYLLCHGGQSQVFREEKNALHAIQEGYPVNLGVRIVEVLPNTVLE